MLIGQAAAPQPLVVHSKCVVCNKYVCLQGAALQGIEPDEETLRLIMESIRGGADDSDEDEDDDEMQQVTV